MKGYESDEETSSVGSSRSVTFADDIISEVITVPRYEEESMSELFYNSVDMMRFRHEARMEKMGAQVMCLNENWHICIDGRLHRH